MRRLVLLLGLAACGPSLGQVQTQMAALDTLATATEAEHKRTCSPPFPPSTTGGEPSRPPRCVRLETCMERVRQAAKACKAAVDLWATGLDGSFQARICRAAGSSACR